MQVRLAKFVGLFMRSVTTCASLPVMHTTLIIAHLSCTAGMVPPPPRPPPPQQDDPDEIYEAPDMDGDGVEEIYEMGEEEHSELAS